MHACSHFEAEAGKPLYLIKDQQNYIIAGGIFRKKQKQNNAESSVHNRPKKVLNHQRNILYKIFQSTEKDVTQFKIITNIHKNSKYQ